MRITNNMILHNAASNINSNKINVDKGENQMTTQTKIQRPSDDPVIAIRSLALQTRLSQINQYYKTNIPDARSWMDVTETALNNIISSMKDLKYTCVHGSTDTLNANDRRTILQQLQSLQESVFAQGNADYAGRTVFTGYRTDKTLVFTDADSDKKYNITQELSANDFEKVKYFNNAVTVPANGDEIGKLDGTGLSKDDITIQDSSYKRLRLAYDSISDAESFTFSYKNPAGETVTNTFQLVQQDDNRIPPLAKADQQDDGSYALSYSGGVTHSDTREVKDAAGNVNRIDYTYREVGKSVNAPLKDGSHKDQNGNTVTVSGNGTSIVTKDSKGNTLKTETISTDPTTKSVTDTVVTTYANNVKKTVTTVTYPDGSWTRTTNSTDNPNQYTTEKGKSVDSTTHDGNDLPSTVLVFDSEADWADWSKKNAPTNKGKLTKYAPDDAMVFIKETGDLIFGKSASDAMSAKEVSVAVNYDKNSFSSGELKPEYYYDCVDNTAVNYANLDATIGQRQVYDRSTIDYDINYTVAVNQTLTVNIQADDVFDSSIQQDIKDLTSVITNAQNAEEKRDKIQTLIKDADYQDPETQAKLSEWYTAAQKEYDYYNDYMQKEFERVLGNVDTYINKANLGDSMLGCRGDELKMTEQRMDEQQESVIDLKNQNDNEDISTIMMNYTAYYTAYQASLVAAGKLGEQSLLNYI